ncbi:MULTISPECIES: TetR/AcrR family transcriptional regulator [unclassified Agarivorans]|nr:MULTISPECIES: TetR/AcrR family transcriptional regulator [unclassified Agarivorans]MDO6686562.1 TetR/AcrR family transcriptional regulator [Agarivorans sp. 3_MG-2023]MDO6715380.1 TetR/AcrR family transcriptional regulator [Agarivorans sp. 2_MG-2023]MDO6763303.1 TetR/AcrR family transcriptional regulator [Agarivorans sp. 1_MG-2023]
MIPDKHLRILMAAEHLIERGGIDALSMQRVAKEAKVAAGTIYLYFKDKDELMAQLHERNLRLFTDAFLAGVDANEGLKEQHRRLWLNALNYHLAHVNVQRLWVHLETLPKNAHHKQLIMELFEPVKLFFSRGVEEGCFKALPGEMLYALAFGQIHEICRFSFFRDVTFTKQDMDAALLASWDAITIHP